MSDIDISVVIPLKNGQRYLDSALEAVFSQEINAKFEVIVIDSGSTDKTPEIIAAYPVRCYKIKENEFNHGLTRNFGISKTQGRYIILMTQDAVPYDNHWMERLIDAIRPDKRIAGVYSRHIPHKDSHPLSQSRVRRSFISGKIRRESRINKIENYERLSPKEKYRLCNFDNVSSCIRKNVWEKIPFSKTDFAEDLEWSREVLRAGYKIIYEPASVVYHSHDFSIFDWYKRNRVNFNKLSTLFGLNSANNFFKLLVIFLAHIFKDIHFLHKDKRCIKIILFNLHLIAFYSFFGALGQYRGIRDSFYSRNKS